MNQEEWKKYSKAVTIKRKYILTYLFEDTQEYNHLTEEVRKGYYDCDVLSIPTGGMPEERFCPEDGIGVGEFLYLFQNAEVIITNSFHGLAFAIIFHKDFWICERKTGFLKGDLRLKSLLNICGIENRSLEDIDGLQVDEIDYKSVQERLDKWSFLSEQFLAMSLHDNKSIGRQV